MYPLLYAPWTSSLDGYVRNINVTIIIIIIIIIIAKCSYLILSTQNIKFDWFVMKIKKFLLPIWWYNRGLFPLGINIFGCSFWMG